MYIVANPTKFTDDKSKILLILSYMREGTASMFAQRYYYDRELRIWKAGEARLVWGTFANFLTELAKAFQDEGTEQKARQKLFTMRMGKRTADDFVADFQITAAESGFDMESTVDYFRRAIHPEILKQIYRLLDMPVTVADWIKYTQRFDNQWRELQSIKSSIPAVQRTNPFRYNSSNAPSSMNNSVVPMAIDSVRTPLTDAERARLRSEGGCFYCRQKGHMANQCPARDPSRIPQGAARYVQLSDRKMGNNSGQARPQLAGGGRSDGRAFSARAQSSSEEAAQGPSRSVATTNPFRARLTARQTHSSGEDAAVRSQEPEVSGEEIERFIGKLRWDEQEALLQALSRESGRKESDANF